MTDLLSHARSRLSPGEQPTTRPPTFGALLAGVAAPAAVLLCCAGAALAGWFAADAGGHGTTRDALRVGADAWLLAHGSGLELGSTTIGVVPLGLTLVSLLVTFRLARWAAASSDVVDLRGWGQAVVVLAGSYGAVAVLVGVLASAPEAQPGLGRAFLGGVAVGVLGGASGLLAGSGLGGDLRDRLPAEVVPVLYGAAATVLLVATAGAVLVAGALVADLGTATNVLSSWRIEVADGLLVLLLVVAVVPNLTLLGVAYLLGPGFAVGTGTVVAPSEVVLGPLPTFPVVAALPDPGQAPWWAGLLVAVPPLLAGIGAALAVRSAPCNGYVAAGLRGLASGASAALALTLLVLLAGGPIGPGRMADVGAAAGPVLLTGLVGLGLAGTLGGLLTAWWQARAGSRPG